MNTYFFHMLMQAREYKASRQRKIKLGKGSNVCPFCTHDFICSNWEVQEGFVEPDDLELTCWRCPLLSAIKVEDIREVMEYCERMGKQALASYTNYFDGGDTAWDNS